MALLLANGSMSSNTNNEGEIRKKLIEDDYVECMVALPGQLFTNTQIPACIWLLTRDKRNGLALNKQKRDRRGQFLFIDARQLGYMKDRVLRDFTVDDIKKVADTFNVWQTSLPSPAGGGGAGGGWELPGHPRLLLFRRAGRHPQTRACPDTGALCGRGRAGRRRRGVCRQDGTADHAIGGTVWGKCQAGGGDQKEPGGVGVHVMSDKYMAIVDSPFDPETSEQPFGQRWGGDVFTLTAEHLSALHAGKAIALDVMNEYLTFVVLEKPINGE